MATAVYSELLESQSNGCKPWRIAPPFIPSIIRNCQHEKKAPWQMDNSKANAS